MAEPVWPLSAAGEPFLRAEIVSKPSSHSLPREDSFHTGYEVSPRLCFS